SASPRRRRGATSRSAARERGLVLAVEAALGAARTDADADDQRLVVERARAGQVAALQPDRPLGRRLLADAELDLPDRRARTAAPAILAATRVHQDPARIARWDDDRH